ncbi:MAG: nucleotidyltransferase family protein [Nitrospirota bacterium]
MTLPDEDRLTLLCACGNTGIDRLEQIKHLVSLPLGWNALLKTAVSYGIAPLFYHTLKCLTENHAIPHEVMIELKRNYIETAARNMYLYSELAKIAKSFHEKGVEIILLKGIALAKFVYRNIGLRPMTDIDLLVKRNDLTPAMAIMSQLNFEPQKHALSQQWYSKSHYHLPPYMNSDKSISIELHWDVTQESVGIDIDKWWERAKETNLDGYKVLLPSPEDMIIHICLHLCNHGYPSTMFLKGLRDILETLNYYRDEINWELLENEVYVHRIQKPVFTMLYFLKKLYGYHEKPLENILFSNVDMRLLKILEERAFIGDDSISAIPAGLIKALASDTLCAKAKILLPVVFPPAEVMSRRHPDCSYLFKMRFYLLRPLRLCLKYGKSAISMYRLKT